MDKELREYLDRQFKSIDERFDGVNKRFDGVDKRFDGVDKRFEGVDKRFEGLEAEVRQTRVVVEGIQGQVQLLAEGLVAANESRERFQEEVAKDFNEVRATMDLHFSHLDRRLKKPESPRRPPKGRSVTA